MLAQNILDLVLVEVLFHEFLLCTCFRLHGARGMDGRDMEIVVTTILLVAGMVVGWRIDDGGVGGSAALCKGRLGLAGDDIGTEARQCGNAAIGDVIGSIYGQRGSVMVVMVWVMVMTFDLAT